MRSNNENDKTNWHLDIESYGVTDVRNLGYDPFQLIMELADNTADGDGFAIIQRFEPLPIINILNGKGFVHLTKKISDSKYIVYFHKTESPSTHKAKANQSNKVPVVIQSATPVVYPILLKMLQSEKLSKMIEISDLKIWEETEKHMGWITSGKADITFSAIVAASKLYATGQDIKLLSVNIWDNFNLLTRGYVAHSLSDLKGHTIHMPLFKSAPPYAITSYLMKKEGLNPNEFDFEFGEPFGRPDEMKDKFISGEIDTVLLREPESSFALAKLKEVEVSVINYGDLWRKIHPDLEKLPNAGLIVKGEFYRNHKEILNVFIEELDKATQWVKENPDEAALLSYKKMEVSFEEAKLFCSRVTFEHKLVKEVKDEIKQYIDILKNQGVIKLKKDLDEEFFGTLS
ncbi:hypothetical protein BHF71_09495 [Vulcanibacillus modesticaldus]|uniref:SsuA/THI5-like domain-containing protein n=1 Tax=Vulcanibacillus modesticaldus TaxID=337097 RepID=A0A1D2YU59_9BACI|nr:DUF2249 domain-containing protein [Vulcanibacillus modesticaldus]OEF99216.1 hypothetical protein BHF71_09495 [Vulcanibacillus modesticaldus]